ncbi:hypothetical protein G7Y89_g14675 [Cudoniella acicularis]|uniref:F-box domain-containing protein n=1 Tax=Cudoniella acicularis TaxID=354080 RepID=A0A8H4VTW4_9HELO|nr:hypothetical protein G7Y89_g14675 [Cudoniella acicularis]
MSIQRLPPEIWDNVFSGVQDSDWKQLRLVCKRFEPQATACLFSHLSVCLQTKSLTRLVGIAESARLNRYVLSLAIGDEILTKHAQVTPSVFVDGLEKVLLGIDNNFYPSEHLLSWDEYQNIGMGHFPNFYHPAGLDQIGLNRELACSYYREVGDKMYEHSKLIQQNLDIWYLAAAFSNLKNLTTVRLSINNNSNGKRSWGCLSDSEYILSPGREKQDRQLHVFLAAAASSRALNISDLIVDDNNEGKAVSTNRGFAHISKYLLDVAIPSLRFVTRLDIPVGESPEVQDGPHSTLKPRIAELLRGLPYLEHFTLRNRESACTFRFKVSSVLAAISSNSLESINLEGCVSGGTWESIFRFMRDRMQLEELVLASRLYETLQIQIGYKGHVGDPGCGKSALAKYLIDSVLATTESRTACYFFKDDFKDQRKTSPPARNDSRTIRNRWRKFPTRLIFSLRTYLWVHLTLNLIESDINIDKTGIVEATSYLPETVDEAYERILSRTLALGGNHHSYRELDLISDERVRERLPEYLLKNDGIGLNSKDGTYGRSALSWAAGNGFATIAKLLIKGTRSSLISIIQLMSREEAEVDSVDRYGRTPLTYAVWNGHVAVVKLLLKEGARADLPDEIGGMPLSYAVVNGHQDLVTLLLGKGARVNPENEVSEKLLLSAAKYGHKEVVKLLPEKGTNSESKDSTSQTPLSWPASKGHEAVVKLLLEKGADFESKDSSSRTPLGGSIYIASAALVKGK